MEDAAGAALRGWWMRTFFKRRASASRTSSSRPLGWRTSSPRTGTRPVSGPGMNVVSRPTNNAGGLEGGVTNGEDLRVSIYMKPIATLMKPLRSIDLTTMEESPAAIERSDVCAVPAAAVVAEAMVAFVLADALTEKFGSDSVEELQANWKAFRDRTSARFARS